LVLTAVLLLTLSGSIFADDPAPAEILYFSVEEGKCRCAWWPKDGGFAVGYPLAEMLVYPNDRNGNTIVHCKGTHDWEDETWATIEEVCEYAALPPYNLDICNDNHQGAIGYTGSQINSPICSRTDKVCTYNFSVVHTPSGQIELRAALTPTSTFPCPPSICPP
jgi:hypothetical protein